MKAKTLRLSSGVQKKIEKNARYMLIGVILCCCAPFLYLFSMQMQANLSDLTLMELVENNALISLNMIIAFASPLCGYILFLMRKRVLEKKDFEVVYLNLALLLITQVFSMNILYMCMFAFFLYRIFGLYEKPFKEAFKVLNVRFAFNELGGSILLFLLFAMVCVLTLRLNFI